jgi:hypothetical protein
MVAQKILPKIVTVGGQMLYSPQTALYWGSYLMKVCDETQSLCMQFESVVTNGRLSFSDIQFLQISDDLAALFRLTELGGIDWQNLLVNLSTFTGTFTEENLKNDLSNLYSLAEGLGANGIRNASGIVYQRSAYNGNFMAKAETVWETANRLYALYNDLESNAGSTVLSLVGGPDNVSRLFQTSNYNLTAWISDYAAESSGQYYTQKWYIVKREQGSQRLCDYYPSTASSSILYGSEWTRFDTSDSSFSPNSAQTETILSNSERYAGYSRAKVERLNAANDGYSYAINYYRQSYLITKGGKQTKKAYAYDIHVTQSWNRTETVVEQVFDSYTMDLSTFRKQLDVQCAELNRNADTGTVYSVTSDSRSYYQTTDATKLTGCEGVTFSVTCYEGVTLSEGSTRYKCSQCGSSVNAHTRQCAMKTTSTDSPVDTSELDAMEREAQTTVDELTVQISTIEAANKELLAEISKASVEDAVALRQQYNQNLTTLSQLKRELKTAQEKLDDIQEAQSEADTGEAVYTDDYYRIPALMNDCRTSFNLTWTSAGSWMGNSYVRTATIPNINGTITFRATLSIARKPKYFLGIKIHRAIVLITWSLTSEYSDSQVVDVMVLDSDKSEDEKAREVNRRISEIAREYPGCDVSTQYAKNEPSEEDASQDTYHLLWSSDRLDIAREVDTRLTQIYADLVSLEKLMWYKRSVLDVFKGILPRVDDNEGRHRTLLEECHEQWMRSAERRER